MVYVQFFNSMGDKIDEYEININTKENEDFNYAIELSKILTRNMSVLYVGDTIKIVEE